MNESATEVSAQPAQQQKFLRYRSVRKTIIEEQSNDPEPVPSLPEPAPVTQSSLTRLPSRYHRKAKPNTQHPPVPIPQTIPSQNNVLRTRNAAQPATEPTPPLPKHSESRINHTGRVKRPSTRETRSKGSGGTPSSTKEQPSPEQLRRSYEVAREEARLILEGEYDRLKALREQEAKRRHDQRLRKEKEDERRRLTQAAPTNTSQASSKANQGDSRLQDVNAARLHSRIGEEDITVAQEFTPTTSIGATISKSRRLIIGGPPPSRTEKKHRRISSAIEPRQSSHALFQQDVIQTKPDEKRNSAPTANAPKFDAPVSAVNSGERRVSVKCKAASITLPVTPSTTAKDILNSAALVMSESIDAQTAVLVECFSQLGLERPLRRYERLRDVMNSWDTDTQHHLLIMEAGEVAARDLHVSDAPAKQPMGLAVQIYISQKPGKWDKRWLKLWDNGQISVSKQESGIDCTNICHLSDFDLFMPTAKQIKKLRPPKKLCFALKSQQKAAMFLDGANFVHFFCTKDKEIADRWYQGVHSWRSWYLVNMLGEGQTLPVEALMGQLMDPRPSTGNSAETTPYVLGSFKPLLDFGSLRPSTEGLRPGESDPLIRPSQDDQYRPLIDQIQDKASFDLQRGASVRRTTKPLNRSYSRRAGLESTQSRESVDDEDSPFTGKGLLARNATRKSQGGNRSGRGVSGVEGRPLVDLQPTSEFTDGSLLRKIEAWTAQEGNSGPKIDRQKRVEVNAPVGEGF
ncbi:hypothetical protein LTR84_005178 [Exophiala bonariae]|uniref:PH domain-containing protein n=1 Tax=Exophiala bonariae TaxID=1690606 RepID=A0AAV9NSZ4_9EURO|nr:hypothetical protein LTR84_005178 [Exophiala bonariae]